MVSIVVNLLFGIWMIAELKVCVLKIWYLNYCSEVKTLTSQLWSEVNDFHIRDSSGQIYGLWFPYLGSALYRSMVYDFHIWDQLSTDLWFMISISGISSLQIYGLWFPYLGSALDRSISDPGEILVFLLSVLFLSVYCSLNPEQTINSDHW